MSVFYRTHKQNGKKIFWSMSCSKTDVIHFQISTKEHNGDSDRMKILICSIHNNSARFNIRIMSNFFGHIWPQESAILNRPYHIPIYTYTVPDLKLLFNKWLCHSSGTGASFLHVFQFPLPIFIPPIAPQSPSSFIQGWYNRPVVAAVPSGLSHPTNNNNNNNLHHHMGFWASISKLAKK
jgi:hypothetical protein